MNACELLRIICPSNFIYINHMKMKNNESILYIAINAKIDQIYERVGSELLFLAANFVIQIK